MDSPVKLRYVFNGLRILCAYTFISGLHYQRRISEPLTHWLSFTFDNFTNPAYLP
jgi:hypothetical protein